jgi:hypothetical protein
MKITKEIFIQTFRNECIKASNSLDTNVFRSSGGINEPSFEIVSNKNVSFFAMRMSNNDEKQTYSYLGKILFEGFVDYKSIELTEEDFDFLSDCFEKAENSARIAVKAAIIANGVHSLCQIIQ